MQSNIKQLKFDTFSALQADQGFLLVSNTKTAKTVASALRLRFAIFLSLFDTDLDYLYSGLESSFSNL